MSAPVTTIMLLHLPFVLQAAASEVVEGTDGGVTAEDGSLDGKEDESRTNVVGGCVSSGLEKNVLLPLTLCTQLEQLCWRHAVLIVTACSSPCGAVPAC